jgi:predicted DNA-binding transcriptional regulator AlpA
MASPKKRAATGAAPRGKQRKTKQPEEKLFLLDCEVDRIVPLSRTTRWRLRKLNQFPEPVRFGRKRMAYRAADIAAVVAGTWQPAAAA